MTKTKYQPVYRMDYAMALIAKGHVVSATIPNPQKSYLVTWIFEVDDTFEEDLKKLLRKG